MVSVDGIIGTTSAEEIPGLDRKIAPYELPAGSPTSETYDDFNDDQGLDPEAQYFSPAEKREVTAILASGDGIADLTHIVRAQQYSVDDPFPDVEYNAL